MANIKSQIKRNRQNEKRRIANRSVRSDMKTRIKSVEVAVESGDISAAETALRHAQKRIDMAVSKGLLKKNTAARRKSRLARQVQRLGS